MEQSYGQHHSLQSLHNVEFSLRIVLTFELGHLTPLNVDYIKKNIYLIIFIDITHCTRI